MKSKTSAVLLAFCLGGLGIHKFYLRRYTAFLVYILFCWTFVPLVLAIFDGLYYLTLSKEKFNTRYN